MNAEAILAHPLVVLFTSWWPICFRSSLYFLAETLPILSVGFYKFAKKDEPAAGWFIAALFANAFYHGIIGLRAYFDGSSVRLMPPKRNGTTFITKPQI